MQLSAVQAPPASPVPPRPAPKPDRDTLLWGAQRFQAADHVWTPALVKVLGNHTPRRDGEIGEAMRAGIVQAEAGLELIEELTGVPTPRATGAFLRDGDKYTQVQLDLATAIYEARGVKHQTSTEAMKAVLAVRSAERALRYLAEHRSPIVSDVFPVLTYQKRP